ncbi:hypothetical protein [Sulfitobacter sp. 1A12157]|uniref:hypothetical protein n=1 Tax=Sulfitobacter sp. 1A12157 TaxID=3368594 RepID=UPI003745763E
MTPAELKAHNAQQARTIKRQWVEMAALKRRVAKERGRNAPLQRMVDFLQARVAELEDPKGQAERFFKDGE